MCTNAKFSVSITQPFNKSEDLAIAKKSTATYWVPIDLPELDFLWSKLTIKVTVEDPLSF